LTLNLFLILNSHVFIFKLVEPGGLRLANDEVLNTGQFIKLELSGDNLFRLPDPFNLILNNIVNFVVNFLFNLASLLLSSPNAVQSLVHLFLVVIDDQFYCFLPFGLCSLLLFLTQFEHLEAVNLLDLLLV